MATTIPPRITTIIRPSRGLLDLDLGAVWRYRELLYFLIWRDLKIRYKQAALGAGWAILQPVFAVAIFTLIFGVFAKMDSGGVPYPVFAFTALLPWGFFSEAARRSSVGLLADAELIRKIYFPRLIISLANALTPLVDFVIAFLVLLILMAWYGVWPSANVVMLPVFLLIAFGLALAVGLWLGPINIRFHDVAHTLPFLLQLWMYATPIVYPIEMVPERWRVLYSLNPMVGVTEGFRWALLGKGAPDFHAIAIGTAVIVVALVTGLIHFKKMERYFADVV